jgi:alanine-glyoxylate transaminase/serine-glyoxylate transaminase/serine-pyruvate transaminase
MDAWGLDMIISATQKGLGTPPGLSVVVASQKAAKVGKQKRPLDERGSQAYLLLSKVLEGRKSPVTSYYASWKRWRDSA